MVPMENFSSQELLRGNKRDKTSQFKKYNEASDNIKRLDRKYGFSGDKC